MISRIEALNYRCLRDVDVSLEPFHILVGPNASGKSTLLDVISFLRDLLNEGIESAIVRRGQSLQELLWMRQGDELQLAVELRLPDDVRTRVNTNGRMWSHCRYEVCLGFTEPNGAVSLVDESLFVIDGSRRAPITREEPPSLFPVESVPRSSIVVKSRKHIPRGWRKTVGLGSGGRANFYSETTNWIVALRPVPQRVALSSVPEEDRFPAASWAKRALSEGVEMMVLSSRAMREPCRPDLPTTFRSDGSNLPIVVRSLQQNHPESFERWLAHLRTVFPALRSISVVEREIDRFLYLVVNYTTGLTIPSWLLSDGTLRLFALTLLAYDHGQGRISLIEEPENGIHPKAAEAVYQSLSSVYAGQVLCATHSPVFVGLARPADLLCFAMTPSGVTSIVKGTEHPALRNWRQQVSLDTLFAAGVLG